MPIYEYRCGKCGFQKEYLQRLNDAPPTKCPECGKRTFNKLVTAAGFQLKGTGWYATDFKNSGAKPTPKAKDQPAEGSGKEVTAKEAPAKEALAKVAPAKETSKSNTASGAGASPASG